MPSVTLEQVLSCPGLPSLPTVAVQVLNLARNRNVQLDQIAHVIQNDPALCARILKTVNSSFFALSKPCPTITRALAYLGLNTVKSLVLGFSLVDWIESSDDVEDLQDYWRRSVCTAAAARRLAAMVKGCDPEEAFVAALVQDIGVLAMRRALGAPYRNVASQCRGKHDLMAAACAKAFGFDHPTVGAALAERWHFPDSIVQAIRHHHGDPDSLADNPPIVQIVALTNRLVCALSAADPQTSMREVSCMIQDRFRLSEDQLGAFISGTMQDARELSQLLSSYVGNMPDVVSMLAQAEDARIQHHLELQRESERLKQDNRNLMRMTVTDPLTGVGNRKQFEAELNSSIAQARSFKGSLALLMVDIDRFKLVNDTFGHLAGDCVLTELAQRMQSVVPGSGTLCRYGGEEFAVILPGAGRREAMRAAEAIRRAAADKAFPLDKRAKAGKSTPVTVSIGVALYDPATTTDADTPQLMLESADKALYAAKNSGRNAVRVYEKHLRKMSA